MEKQLVVINGTMGVGKSAVCAELLHRLQPGVWLDGDWCWRMEPFVVSEENKAMVQRNIVYLLRSFLENSGYQYVLFCWVLHQEALFDALLQPLAALPFDLHKFTLTCTPDALRRRLGNDIAQGLRQADVLKRSLQRLPLYREMHTTHLDVSDCTAAEAADWIAGQVRG